MSEAKKEVKKAKAVQIMGNGKTYVLDYDRESIFWAEETLNFSIDDLSGKKAASATRKLFYIAFHRRYPDEFTMEETTKLLFDEIPAKYRPQITANLIELYIDTYNSLYEESEGEGKNSEWSVKL